MLQESISDQTHDTNTATAATTAATAPESAAGGELGFVSEDGDRNSGGGNRWPRQETVALIKIRSDMDVVFRDSSLKGPLWDDISRKLADLGYNRSAKKCKEKFENVYKYHKRTKDGRVSKQDGKTYRFFEQLEALEGHASTPHTASIQNPNNTNNHFPSLPQPYVHPVTNYAHNKVTNRHNSNIQSYGNLSNSTSSSTSSELDRRGMKRKRKWKDFFERIMREVIDKQEALQTRFLENLERRERDRIIKEEAWRVQEMAKMNREHDLLVHERSLTAAKDAAVISFLQKMAEQTPTKTANFLPQNPIQVNLRDVSFPQPTQTISPVKTQPLHMSVPVLTPLPVVNSIDKTQPTQTPVPVLELSIKSVADNALAIQSPISALTLPIKSPTSIIGDNTIPPSPSRWPKAEIQALISLRTTLDMKYLENGPKGPLWEEISSGMKRIGYNRNAKRCKEKWENINKYYKKMKESNKKRPQDAKTCPYFDQLDAIYNEKAKNMQVPINHGSPIMATPQQQWPLAAPPLLPPPNVEKKVNDDDNDDDESGEDENEEDEIDGYEIVQSKPSSMENVQ